MSTLKSSAENLTLNADGSNNDIILQSNGTTKVTLDGQNGRVGIGTTAPAEMLEVQGASGLDGATPPTIKIHSSNEGTWTDNATFAKLAFGSEDTAGGIACSINAFVDSTSGNNSGLSFYTSASANTPLERARINKDGDLGIGTITPDVPLDVVGNIRASTGILFGTDTAAANALDDYEEGTWTTTTAAGWASTTLDGTGSYTKIGNIVHVIVQIHVNGSGTGSGDIQIGGLPFTSSSTADYRTAISIYAYNLASSVDTYVAGLIDNSGTTIAIKEGGLTGTGNDMGNHFDAGSSIFLQATYRV